MAAPRILTTTVGSYSVPEWLAAHPSEEALLDATRNIFALQREVGIDLPTDGEFYRFDPNHPDTNGMIDYFVRPLGGVRQVIGRTAAERFRKYQPMAFRRKPAGVITGQVDEGGLDLLTECQRSAAVSAGPFKFTLTSPYMLARTLLDEYYGTFDTVCMKIADVLASQLKGLPCQCIQV
ncbi:MAG: methionine synthase, partial [Phycisphaerae bacterium]|nr:methionine synthase [Phycisphaerae bacterium]